MLFVCWVDCLKREMPYVRNNVNAFAFIARAARGDWGELVDEGKQANERALLEDATAELLHAAGEKFYVITESDWSVTTLPRARGA
jgi:hypothetical protein